MFIEGDPTTHVFRVETGAVALYKVLADGRRQIVGWSYMASGSTAVMWEGRTLVDLNDVTAIPLRQPEGQTLFVWAHLVSAAAVDENGWIVGFGHSPSGQHRAFLLKPLQVAYVP